MSEQSLSPPAMITHPSHPKPGSKLMTSLKFSTASSLRSLITAGVMVSSLVSTPLAEMSAQAADHTSFQNSEDDSSANGVYTKRITMAVGRSIIFDLPQDAAEIFIGSPNVANAVVRSARKIYLVGVANGTTTLFAMDKAGKRIATIEIVVGRDTAELRALLKAAMPKSNVEIRTVGDTIILSGEVDSALEAQKAYDIADAYVGYSVVGGTSGGSNSISFSNTAIVKGKLINSIVIRGKDQVMLKVTIAEVKRNIIKQLGISTSGSWGAAGANSAGGLLSKNPLGLNSALTNMSQNVLSSAGSQGTIAASIQAFERNGVAHVLAEPTVTAISGESAKFVAGGTVPTVDSATCSSPSTFNPFQGASSDIHYKDQPYGVSLTFTPTVLSEGRIQLHVGTEVTEVEGLVSGSFYCANHPSTRTRRNETTVELPSGGSIISAGLIQQKSAQVIQGQPGLMNLPILGSLFRSRDFMKEETELMIVVTPYISRTLRPDEIALPNDGFADSSDMQGNFLGRVNRIYSTSHNPQLVKGFKGRVGFITD